MPTNPIIYEHRRIIKPILTGITSGEPNPNIIQGFIEDFKPDYYYEISVTDVEGYTLLNTMPGTKTRMVLYLV